MLSRLFRTFVTQSRFPFSNLFVVAINKCQAIFLSLCFRAPVHESRGAGTSFESTTSGPSQAKSLPTEPDVPLWRKISVPGAVVLGAVGAVGVYHAASRSTLFNGYSSSSDNQTAQQQQASAPNGNGYVSGNGAANGTRYNSGQGARQVDENIHGEHNYTRESPVDHSADGNACFASTVDDRSGIGIATSLSRITSSGDLEDAVVSEALGGISASDLAGEFRRLSQAMEQQTGQLVEAVGAMKSLASRAEQDSSSLLAARVNNHTSELRAELGTIKQLLLLQSGPGGGVAMEAAEVAKEGKGSIEVTGGGAGPGEGVRPGGGSADTIEIITNGAAGTATAGRNGSVHFGNSPSSVGNVGGKLSMTSATCGTVSPEVKGPKQGKPERLMLLDCWFNMLLYLVRLKSYPCYHKEERDIHTDYYGREPDYNRNCIP